MSIPEKTINPKHRGERFSVANLLIVAIRAIRGWNTRRGVLKDLSRLDPRLLQDIGLGPGDLPQLAERMAETASRPDPRGVSQDSGRRDTARHPAARGDNRPDGASCCAG